jgi:hypothetical protein
LPSTFLGVADTALHIHALLRNSSYTVLPYDPRGKSRSVPDDPTADQDLDIHGDDAAARHPTRAAVVLAERLGSPPVTFPGDHGAWSAAWDGRIAIPWHFRIPGEVFADAGARLVDAGSLLTSAARAPGNPPGRR